MKHGFATSWCRAAAAAAALAPFFSASAGTPSAGKLPRVWASTVRREPFEETVADCAAHGVDVVEAVPWSLKHCTDALDALRKHGLKGFTTAVDVSEDSRGALAGRPFEKAVFTGGAFRGLAVDRHLFAFTPEVHEIVVEPPVYSERQPYVRKVAGPDGEERTERGGHYFGGFVPTGEAEIVVPEALYDGRQHLRVVPCEVLPARPEDVPEGDTAAPGSGLGGSEIEGRRLVRLRFDLSDCADCLLDKVGIAVYWTSDEETKWWKDGSGALSVFSPLTREAARRDGEVRMARWREANGGVFPADEIIAVRFGDECFNLTGWLDCPAASFPLWGFSPSGRAAFAAAAPGLEMPRTWGCPEIYGPDACGLALYLYHKACAELVAAFRDGARSVAPDILVFRNTTRGRSWSEQNDHDGSGQELLARTLDFVHLDPYPVHSGYSADVIPFDMAYVAGFARRFGKPLVPWMQAHAYAPNGLGHVTPEQLDRMMEQHAAFSPDAIVWLGYDAQGPSGTGARMTFPHGNPESWEHAAKLHERLHSEEAGGAAPATASPAPIAIVRPYETRAACCSAGSGVRNPADSILREFAAAWSVDAGLQYDVFEVPPAAAGEESPAPDLSAYAAVVSSAPVPGRPDALVLGTGTEGTVLSHGAIREMRGVFARDIASRGIDAARPSPLPEPRSVNNDDIQTP